MTILSRRKFFGAAVATPIAIRQAAGEAAAGQLGRFGIPVVGSGPVPVGYDNDAPDPYQQAQSQITKYIREKKIPEWQMIHFRREARQRARFLDADIINMRSLSDATRYRIQEARELHRVCQEYLDNDTAQSGWTSLYKSFRDRVWPGS